MIRDEPSSGWLRLRVGTDWTELEISSEPFIIYTRRGYAPCIEVKRNKLAHILFLSSISITEQFEKIRKEKVNFTNTRIRIRKKSEDKFSPYVVEVL